MAGCFCPPPSVLLAIIYQTREGQGLGLGGISSPCSRGLARGMQGGVNDQRLGQWNFAFVTAAAVASGFDPRAESPSRARPPLGGGSWGGHRSSALCAGGGILERSPGLGEWMPGLFLAASAAADLPAQAHSHS